MYNNTAVNDNNSSSKWQGVQAARRALPAGVSGWAVSGWALPAAGRGAPGTVEMFAACPGQVSR